MRYKHKVTAYTLRHIRVKTRFLWFPKRISNETRWLETATYTQKYTEVHTGAYTSKEEWVDLNWIN